MPRLFLLSFALVILPSFGCPADPPSNAEEAAACSVDFPLEGTRASETLEIGTFSEGAFVATADEGHMPTQIGGQGFTMITPAFRLPKSAGDGDELCLLVKIEHEPLDAPSPDEVSPGSQVTIRFVLGEDGYVSDGVVFDVLGEAGLPSFRMNFTASVIGPDFEAKDGVTNVFVGAGAF